MKGILKWLTAKKARTAAAVAVLTGVLYLAPGLAPVVAPVLEALVVEQPKP